MKINKNKFQKHIYQIVILGIVAAVVAAIIAGLSLESPTIRVKKYENNSKIKLEEFRKDSLKISIEHPLLGRFLQNYIVIDKYRFNLCKFSDSKGTEGNQYNYYFPIDTLGKKYPDIFKRNETLTFNMYSESPLGKKSYESFKIMVDIILSSGPSVEQNTIKKILASVTRKCEGYSKIGYKDDDGNLFYAKFSNKGYIENICCEKTGKYISWRSFQNSPTFSVRKDTVIIIEEAMKWLKKNMEDNYINLTTK